jgi:hypothetical protein
MSESDEVRGASILGKKAACGYRRFPSPLGPGPAAGTRGTKGGRIEGRELPPYTSASRLIFFVVVISMGSSRIITRSILW